MPAKLGYVQDPFAASLVPDQIPLKLLFSNVLASRACIRRTAYPPPGQRSEPRLAYGTMNPNAVQLKPTYSTGQS
jgi:hypothetical protein